MLKCVELGECTLMRAYYAVPKTVAVTPGDPGWAARSKAKMGRELAVEAAEAHPVLASASHVSCEHACRAKKL